MAYRVSTQVDSGPFGLYFSITVDPLYLTLGSFAVGLECLSVR